MPEISNLVTALLTASATSSSITVAVFAFTRRLQWRAYEERGAPREQYDALSWIIWLSATVGFIATLILLFLVWYLADLRFTSFQNATIEASAFTLAIGLVGIAIGLLLFGMALVKRKEDLNRCSLKALRD